MKILSMICFLLCITILPSYAGSVSMTTYYPAPTGYYNQLSVTQGVSVKAGGTCSTFSTQGATDTAVINTGGVLYTCTGPSATAQLLNYWGPAAAANTISPLSPNTSLTISGTLKADNGTYNTSVTATGVLLPTLPSGTNGCSGATGCLWISS